MKTTHYDPRLLTRFTNRALVIGSSAALTLGLGMTGFVPAAFATETPTPEAPSQESPAELTPVTDPAPSDADAQNQPVTDPAANDPAASAILAAPVQAPPAPAEPAVPAVPSGSVITTADNVTGVGNNQFGYVIIPSGPYAKMYGDALVKRTADEKYDTQHKKIFEVNPGDNLDIKSNLDVSAVVKPMDEWVEKAIETFKDNPRISKDATTGKNLVFSSAYSEFQTVISVPKYLDMPTDPKAYTLETHNGDEPLYRISSVLVPEDLLKKDKQPEIETSDYQIAINLALNDFYAKPQNGQPVASFLHLRDVFAAYANKPLSLVISGVKVKDNIPHEGAKAQLTFRTRAKLIAKRYRSSNRYEYDEMMKNSFTDASMGMEGYQDHGQGGLGYDGTDSTFKPMDPEKNPIIKWIISLTMDIKPKPTPADPVVPNPNQPVIPDTPSVVPGPVPGGTVVPPSEPVPPVAGVTTTPAAPEPPVAGVFTPAAPRIPVAQGPDRALAATGSSAETLAGGAMIVFLAGGAMMVASRRRARR